MGLLIDFDYAASGPCIGPRRSCCRGSKNMSVGVFASSLLKSEVPHGMKPVHLPGVRFLADLSNPG